MHGEVSAIMPFNPLDNPYPSQRMTIYGSRGMVATAHPLAAQAGLSVLQQGGNAVDAAIATAAALTVVEPTSNGIGGDAFAIVCKDGRLYGLNASGPAPQGLSIAAVTARGHRVMPDAGWLSVTVPGVPAAWAALSARFGQMGLSRTLSPAITLAEMGHPVAPIVSKYWQLAARRNRDRLMGPEFQGWFETFAPNGHPPAPGEIWRAPDHAKTLQRIAETAAEAFYRGDVAERIDQFSRSTGGLLRLSDLAAFQPTWVDPIHVRYHGYDVWELPPNGQGIVALMALNILDGWEVSDGTSEQTMHRQIEAIKLAFADAKATVTDPEQMRIPVAELLSKAYAEQRRQQIGERALEPSPGRPDAGGTVYLATADNDGNMVSYIQSNYMGFGSGIVVPGTGVSLQNRGHTFSLDPHHINALAPGKRTYHTIIPGFLTKDELPIGPFGVMGGFMQPQGHVQVVTSMVDAGHNPQAALDKPRWQWEEGKQVNVESNFPSAAIDALRARGHALNIVDEAGSFGRGQIIWRLPNGVLSGATESRADGHVAVW